MGASRRADYRLGMLRGVAHVLLVISAVLVVLGGLVVADELLGRAEHGSSVTANAMLAVGGAAILAGLFVGGLTLTAIWPEKSARHERGAADRKDTR